MNYSRHSNLIHQQAGRSICASWLAALLLLALPAALQAQFTYTTNNGTITITGYTGPGGAVSIPNTINGLPVTSIGNSAFEGCRSLTGITIPDSVTAIGNCSFEACGLMSVTIPDSVTDIGYDAFNSCTSLTSVTIGNGVTRISDWMLGQCYGLLNVTIPHSVTCIGGNAFGGCRSLTEITIPDSVTNIGIGSFTLCGLVSVTIPDSVTSIGYEAFYYCIGLTNVTIPHSVTNIGADVFAGSDNLTEIAVDAFNSVYSSVDGVLFNKSQTTLVECPGGKSGSYTVPGSVTEIWGYAFDQCHNLTSVTIGNNVTNIEDWAFSFCSSLTSVTIPNSVTSIGDWAFAGCTSLTGVYFSGNAPSVAGSQVFYEDSHATVYYLPGTTGWGTTFGGLPTVLWNPLAIHTSPQTQTAEAGSAVCLRVKASGAWPLSYSWYLNNTNLVSCSTISDLALTNVQFSQSGAYSVVVTNATGAVTSSPAMLNVIAPVERRPVPGVKVTGAAGSFLNLDSANSLIPAPNWTTLGSVSLSSTSQYYFDLTLPLPAQRFYRAWQTGTPSVIPSLDLHIVPAITVTGTVGRSVRVDYINQIGPTDAWVTLDTVVLTNTSELYFDTSAWGQPPRLYRLVLLP